MTCLHIKPSMVTDSGEYRHPHNCALLPQSGQRHRRANGAGQWQWLSGCFKWLFALRWPFSQRRTTRTIHITQNRSQPIVSVATMPEINVRVGASSSNRLLKAKSEPATKDSWSGFISATRLIPFGSGSSHLPSAVLNPVIVCVDRVIT